MNQRTERWRVPLGFSLKNAPRTDARGGLFAADFDGHVTRYDPDSGKPLWTFRHQPGRFSDPSFTPEGDVLVVADLTRAFVLDRETGEKKSEVPLDHGTLSQPAPGPDGTLLLVGSGDGIMGKQWTMYCVDPKTPPKKSWFSRLTAPIALMPRHGTVSRWEVPIRDNPESDFLDRIPMTPQGETHRIVPLDNGLAAITGGNQEVVAVDPRQGSRVWRTEIPGRGLYDPVPLGSDRLAVFGPDRLHYLDAASGRELGSEPVNGVVFSQPTSDLKGNLYFFSNLDQLNVIRADGTRWSQKGDLETRISPTADANNVYVVKRKGESQAELFALDPANGEENFRLQVDGSVTSSPVVLPDGSLVVKVRRGEGEELLSVESPAALLNRPQEAGPAVVEGTGWVSVGGIRLKTRRTEEPR